MIRLVLPPLCVARKMTVDSENIDNTVKISQTNKERERTFIFLKRCLCDMFWYICRSQIPRLDRHQCERRQSWSSLGSSVPAPQSWGLWLPGRVWSGTSCISALFEMPHAAAIAGTAKLVFILHFFLDWGYKAASVRGKSAKTRVHQSRSKSVLASDPFSASFQVKYQAFPDCGMVFETNLIILKLLRQLKMSKKAPGLCCIMHLSRDAAAGWAALKHLSPTQRRCCLHFEQHWAHKVIGDFLTGPDAFQRSLPILNILSSLAVCHHSNTHPPIHPSRHSSVCAQAGTQLSPLCLETTFQFS